MGYLVCEKCGGYYELKEGEAIDDFEGCQCGGKFKFVKTLDELNLVKDKQSDSGEKSICPNCGSKNDTNTKFCGSCGKPLKTSITPDPDKKQSQAGKPFYCPNCGTENLITTKTCISCGKPLNIAPKNLKLSILDKFSKYGNKRNFGIVGTSIIGIALIAFLILWLPANVFANHYDDGYISFDYPSTLNITSDKNVTSEVFNSISTGGLGGSIVDVNGGNRSSNGAFLIFVDVVPTNHTENVPINTTVNQTVGIDENGNNITAPSNESTNQTQTISVNILEGAIDNYTKTTGKQINKTNKNGFTYYELEPDIKENTSSTFSHDVNTTGHVVNTTIYTTIIEKKGLPYFFMITLDNTQSPTYQYNNDGYTAYRKIVDSFRLG